VKSITINEAVVNLAKQRQQIKTIKQQISAAEAELAASDLGQQLAVMRENLKNATATASAVEQEVRDTATKIYDTLGEKTPHPAVKIKMYTVLDYDPQAALTFSAKHLPKALRLNKTVFERAAKIMGPDFVTISQERRATIARDLSKYME